MMKFLYQIIKRLKQCHNYVSGLHSDLFILEIVFENLRMSGLNSNPFFDQWLII